MTFLDGKIVLFYANDMRKKGIRKKVKKDCHSVEGLCAGGFGVAWVKAERQIPGE